MRRKGGEKKVWRRRWCQTMERKTNKQNKNEDKRQVVESEARPHHHFNGIRESHIPEFAPRANFCSPCTYCSCGICLSHHPRLPKVFLWRGLFIVYKNSVVVVVVGALFIVVVADLPGLVSPKSSTRGQCQVQKETRRARCAVHSLSRGQMCFLKFV